MRGKLAIAGFLLAVTCRVAVAGTVDECHLEFQPDVSLRACTEIIESPSFGPDEKAFAYRFRGDSHTNAGAVGPAIADFTESIRLKKDNMSAFAGRGRAKFTAGNLAGSIDDYGEAIRLSPVSANSAELHTARGHVYTVSGNADAAIRDLTEAIRLNPSSATAFNERGLAHAKKGDLVRAQEDYTASIALLPTSEGYINRGYVYEAQGRTMDATDDFRRALLINPSLVDARDALKRLGDVTGTIETDQRVRQGRSLVEKSCGSCHAVGATGVSPNRNAPEFRNLNRRHPLYALSGPVIRGIHATHDQMPQFKLSDEESDTIVAYINSLSTSARR